MARSHKKCRYCAQNYQSSSRVILENKHWIGIFDNHPVSPGHMKLMPKKHQDSFSELSNQELVAFRLILRQAEALIRKEYVPDGLNIGINQGLAAGQTVFHLHIHVIPRFKGDVANPAGGVRTILPGGNYLKGET